jgi:hypothetical protein
MSTTILGPGYSDGGSLYAASSGAASSGSDGPSDIFDGGYVGVKWLKNMYAFVVGYFDSSLSTPYGGQIFPTGGNSGGSTGQIFPA